MSVGLDAERAVAIVAIGQLVHGWAHELDSSAGRGLGDLVTDDCAYDVGGEVRRGRDAVLAFYEARHARLTATAEGLPTLRHLISNLRVSFDGPASARIGFTLLFFTGAGSAPFPPEVGAVSDVTMTCRRDVHGCWRIARFESVQQFRRGAA